MAVRCRRLREISRFLPRVLSGIHYRSSVSYAFASYVVLPPHTMNLREKESGSLCHTQRYSTASQVLDHSMREVDFSSFMKSSLQKLEGPNYFWLNKVDGDVNFLKKETAPLILIGMLFQDPSSVGCSNAIIQKLKLIQQRFPELYVVGLHIGNVAQPSEYQTGLVQLILEEYITFPILVAQKNFFKISERSGYILFNNSAQPLLYNEKDLDLEVIDKVSKELNYEKNWQSKLFDTSAWILKQNYVKEPYLCLTMQNMLLFSPGCISADESGDRLFISDSNHHRIIIADGNGQILDCIGSSPGFEDGNFETAKLFRPGSTLYDDAEDCLYIVDSENHAIRRADLSRRLVETVFPNDPSNKKSNTIWTWIKDKLGLQKEVTVDAETSDSQVLTFPWHLMQDHDGQIYVISRRFEALWVLDSSSWEIKETVTEFQQIVAVCEELIAEKMSLMKQMPLDYLHQQSFAKLSLDEPEHLSLLSSVTSFGNQAIACDPVGHRVSRFCLESGGISDLELSNFGILGLPYWMNYPIERVYPTVNQSHGAQADHTQNFTLLPGRVEIKLNVVLPANTELVEPLKESSIWRQARGAATEVLESEGAIGSSEKVGVAQQWYDELDNLAFVPSKSAMESIVPDDIKARGTEEDKVQIDCVVNTSPGTCEVIVYAVLYLKLKPNLNQQEGHREKQAARLSELLVQEKSSEPLRSLCRQMLLSSKSNLQDLVFAKPLQVRIRISCKNHPKADNSKDIIVTESSISVNVSL